jgi:Xaa-Pro aminopeptidase
MAEFQVFDPVSTPETGPERLAALRVEMATRGVQGFLVPRADVHQGEYVAPSDERLAWLTSFTGSAGFCAALMTSAGVFIDGRYRVQVKAQVADCFTPVHWPETQLDEWLCKQLPNGGRIAYDPWLHTASEIDKLAKKLEATGIALVTSDNLIDAIWTDRPKPPMTHATSYPTQLAGKSHDEKRAEIAETMRAKGIDNTILTQPESICWLLNIRGNDVTHVPLVHGFCILQADGHATLYMEAEKAVDIHDHLGRDVVWKPRTAFAEDIASLSGKILVDPVTGPVALRELIDTDNAQIHFEQDPTMLPKACKNDVELAGTREAHLRDGAAMCEFLAWVDTQEAGRFTEIDAVMMLEECRIKTGDLKDISFDTISGAGRNAALPHYRVSTESNRIIKDNEVLLIDSGGQYLDGTTDITRTIPIGEQPQHVKEAFTRVLQGMIAISRVRFPAGLAGRDLDVLARVNLWQAGQDYNHGTGHGVGHYLSVHEGPQRLSRVSHVPLQAGMILSNEPGFYQEGEFGIRIENLIVVRAAPSLDTSTVENMFEFETLTYAPIDRRMIIVDMLTKAERDWINAYHADCRDKIGPRVSDETAVWLRQATAEI